LEFIRLILHGKKMKMIAMEAKFFTLKNRLFRSLAPLLTLLLALIPMVFASETGITHTSLNVEDTAPSFTVAPSDGGSDATTPTNAGSNVTFTAMATDINGDLWYLAVCKENVVTPGDNAAPTCGGTGAWAVSSTAAPSGSQQTVITTTSDASPQSNDWYAFACDKLAGAGVAKCSGMSQGTASPSPFKVNHKPTYSAYAATDSGGGTIEPDDDVKFIVTTADTDNDTLQDQIALFVCTPGTTGFDGATNTCVGGVEVCHNTAGLAPPGVLSCTNTSIVDKPIAHANDYGVKVYVVDSHKLVTATPAPQTYAVTDTPPYVVDSSAYTFTAPDTTINITLIAGDRKDKTYTVTLRDDNGDRDIVSATAVLYNATGHSLSGGMCNGGAGNENWCYPGVVCTLSDNTDYSAPGTPGTDNAALKATATCAWTNAGGHPIWFNADFSSNWRMHINPVDGTSSPTGLIDSSAIQVDPIQAINVTQELFYGSIAVGTISPGQAIVLQNQGNQILDVLIQGTDMTKAGGGGAIPSGQQKWFDGSGIDWNDPAKSFLLLNATNGTAEINGCSNRDLAVRAVNNVGTEDQSLYWMIKLPADLVAGSYSGTITFAATPSNTCSGSH
jgi:hypothetical protein